MNNKHWNKIYLLLALVTTDISSVAAQTNSQQTVWPTITNQMKPWARWWWMGNAVDKNQPAEAFEPNGFCWYWWGRNYAHLWRKRL